MLRKRSGGHGRDVGKESKSRLECFENSSAFIGRPSVYAVYGEARVQVREHTGACIGFCAHTYVYARTSEKAQFDSSSLLDLGDPIGLASPANRRLLFIVIVFSAPLSRIPWDQPPSVTPNLWEIATTSFTEPDIRNFKSWIALIDRGRIP